MRENHSLDEPPPHITHTHTHTHTHTYKPTFATLRPVVEIPSWAIATCRGSHRVDASAFVVTAAVISALARPTKV